MQTPVAWIWAKTKETKQNASSHYVPKTLNKLGLSRWGEFEKSKWKKGLDLITKNKKMPLWR